MKAAARFSQNLLLEFLLEYDNLGLQDKIDAGRRLPVVEANCKKACTIKDVQPTASYQNLELFSCFFKFIL